MQKRNAIIALRLARLKDWMDALWFHGFSALGGLAPVWLGAILLILFSVELKSGQFIDRGEFAIYCAATVAPALFTILRTREGPSFPDPVPFGFVFSFLLLVSAAVFAGVTAAGSIPGAPLRINIEFLRWSTVALYCISLIMAFISSVIENALNVDAKDIEQADRDAARKIEQGFNSVEGDFK